MNELEEIKNRLDIVEYIGKYVVLKQSGRNFKGLCPFHSEKSPSFMVSPDKQIWHCFGCNEGGDIISFAEKIEGLDFVEALKMLADKAGVKLTQNTKLKTQKNDNEKYFAINEAACEYYEKELYSPGGKRALDYLKSRGLTDDIIKEFRFGFSPSRGDVLTKHLNLKNFTNEDLVKAGISLNFSKPSQTSRTIDMFRNRLMIPIRNQSGRVVAFTARVLDNSLPKYINTPESPVYHKSDILFGFDMAKEFARKQDHLILVEGNMDMIASYQAGVKNVVAVSGTALTDNQLNLIKRFTKNIKISFDVDMAGQNAARRAIELAWEKNFNIKVIEVPEGKDPADIINIDPKRWILACKKAKYVVDYIFDSTFKKYNLSKILEKKQATKELLVVINKLADPVEKEHYLNILSQEVGVSVGALNDALKKSKSETKNQASRGQKKNEAVLETKKNIRESLDEHVLGLLLVSPNYIDFFFKKILIEDVADEKIRKILEDIKAYYNKEGEFSTKKWLKTVSAEDTASINRIILKIEDTMADLKDEEMAEEIYNSVLRLRKENIAKEKSALAKKIHQAETGGDKGELNGLMKDFQTLIELERKL